MIMNKCTCRSFWWRRAFKMQLIFIMSLLPLANCFICNGWGDRCHVSFRRQPSGFSALTPTSNCPRKALRMASLSTQSDVEEIAMIKNSLLQVAAITERGQLASEEQRKDVELLVGRLEELKEAGEPFKDENMVGIWTLVYSTSQAFRSSPFFATFQALVGREGIAERIFSFTDELPNAKIGQARQIINEDCTELLSRVDMSLWPHRWISGVVETRSRIVNDDVGDRLEVIVDSTRVKESILGKISPRLEGLPVPVDQLSERIFDRIPRIILETVYLDQDTRVSRLPDQNFLVYVKDY